MRITESKLREIISQVIEESYSDQEENDMKSVEDQFDSHKKSLEERESAKKSFALRFGISEEAVENLLFDMGLDIHGNPLPTGDDVENPH